MRLEQLFRTHKFLSIVATGAVVVFGTVPAVGAQLPPVAGGTHVRLALRQSSSLVDGIVFANSADSIGIATGHTARMIPTDWITGLQVSSGRSHTLGAIRGIKIGMLVAAGIMVPVAVDYFSYSTGRHPEDLVATTLVSLTGGAFYGGVIGGAVGAESWATLYPTRVGIAARPLSNGAPGLGLSLKF